LVNSAYRLHTVIMQEIKDYHFRGTYDFELRVRYEDKQYKFWYLKAWHPIEESTLKKMCEQSYINKKLVDKLKLRLVS